ncbi:hypothetical protein SETIT_8G124800v2 [Setaria italica]|uniref:Uncharacterized protein n=1 Tax=Setaria italica TaxID=4555 RepID=A0A368S7A3_SETIT|nr:hypothetical protein SETIT_8G124800v2 [Setaria italica]
MALEAQASRRHSPPRAPDAVTDPPAREAAWPDPDDPPTGTATAPPGSPPADPSTAVFVALRNHASTSKYLPPRATSCTANPDPARVWRPHRGREGGIGGGGGAGRRPAAIAEGAKWEGGGREASGDDGGRDGGRREAAGPAPPLSSLAGGRRWEGGQRREPSGRKGNK